MPTKKRRIRSPHPGVVLKERALPSGKSAWRARFTDADSGRETYVTLDPVALPTHEARRLWAVRKSKDLAKRRMDIEAGAPKKVDRALSEAVDGYLKAGKHRLRATTLDVYEQAVARLAKWAERDGLKTTTELTQGRLAAFRDHLISEPLRGAKAGGRRGERRETAKRRTPTTVNTHLRAVKSMLNALRVGGLLPHLTRDGIADALKALPVPHEQPEYLHAAQIRKLLEAAQRHDAATFAETRNEHGGIGARGTTPRYAPIGPFVAFLLLTGCRRGEALALKWSDIDLEATDHERRVVGEIRLRAEATKTKRARTIGLEVSPALRTMLATMKLRAGESKYVFSQRDMNGKEHPYTPDLVDAARARLMKPDDKDDKDQKHEKKKDKAKKPSKQKESGYGAPKFDWQMLRSTCSTYLTNAPGIFGAATVFMSAKQLGHSVAVAERHYLGVHRGIPRDARTLEVAMQIEKSEPLTRQERKDGGAAHLRPSA